MDSSPEGKVVKHREEMVVEVSRAQLISELWTPLTFTLSAPNKTLSKVIYDLLAYHQKFKSY